MQNSRLIRQILRRNHTRFDTLDFIYRELASRMLSRLDYIKINPDFMLDCGSGMGYDYELLKNKYPNSNIIQVDLVNEFSQRENKSTGWLKNIFSKKTPSDFIVADVLSLPFANSSVDFYYSNLLLPYLSDPVPMVKEMRRVLKVGGGFFITGLGVDSLKELRELGLTSNTFPDMHDIGDMLITAGFTNPVVDTEYLNLDYEHLATLLQDIKLVGCGAVYGSGNYFGKSPYLELRKRLDLPVKLTLEVFVAHGWKDREQIELPDGMSAINFHRTKHSD